MVDTDTTTSAGLRDQADLDSETAVLSGWATKLHSEANHRMEAGWNASGVARDEAAAEAWGLRQKAKSADIQAVREHREATRWESLAAEQEASAATLERGGRSAEAQEAREDADGMRARARSSTERAKEAERRSQEAADAAEPLEEQVRDEAAGKDFDQRPGQIEQVADQLDDKVRLLEEAGAARQEALRLRDAGDQAKAVEAAQRAVDAQAAADAIAPEYHLLEADVRTATGIGDVEIEMDPPAAGSTPSAEPPEIEMDPEVMRPEGQGSTELPEIEMEPEVMRPEGQTDTGVPAEGEADPTIDPEVAAELAIDSDHDGISDFLELRLGTKPDDFDSDGDGLPDGYEDTWRHTGIDPLVADGDNDGSNDGEELARGSDPTDRNTDGDQYIDGDDLLPTDPTNTLGGPRSPAPPTPGPDATSEADPMPPEELPPVAPASDLDADLTEDPAGSSDDWTTDDDRAGWPGEQAAPEPSADEPTLEYDG